MCLSTDSRITGLTKPAARAIEHTGSYAQAPSGRNDCAFLLVGNICGSTKSKFEKIPCDASPCEKPVDLSNLSDELFFNFTKEIQLSLASHSVVQSYTGLKLLMISVVVTALAFFYLPLFLYAVCFDVGVVLFGSLVALGNRNWRKDLQCDIEARIEEWRTRFREHGFSVTCTAGERFCRPAELSLRIYESCKRGSRSVIWTCDGEQEAKYLILFARMFAHRNKTFRVLFTSKELPKNIYIKPPALENLGDIVFQKVMKSLDKSLRAYKIKKRNICCLLAFTLGLPLLLWTPPAVFIYGLIIAYVLIHQFVADQFLFPKSGINECIKKWEPRCAAQNHTIEYCVDQPRWYNWKEGYIGIRYTGACLTS